MATINPNLFLTEWKEVTQNCTSLLHNSFKQLNIIIQKNKRNIIKLEKSFKQSLTIKDDLINNYNYLEKSLSNNTNTIQKKQ